MLIDVIIPTFNRAALLERAVRSVLDARCDGGFEAVVTVVDNNSTDDTAQVVARLTAETPTSAQSRVRYLHEKRQGKSHAVNAALVATHGDIVALADDDQWMDAEWLNVIQRALGEGFDFVTGPVEGDWQAAPPPWYDDRLRGVLSLNSWGDRRIVYRDDENQRARSISGGNVALRRSVLGRVGLCYHPELGKTADTFAMGEDSELFLRLRRAGARGLYEPQMKVSHLVPRERLTKKYFRAWHRGYGASVALLDQLHPQPVSYFCGVPRFMLRQTVEALPKMLAARWRGDLPGSFAQELHFWFMLGFLQGRRAPKPDLRPQTSDLRPFSG
ncbi:MAG: glycosyltransferase [Acidobacteria bacterium]|nr:glycosyltransferase [Acidobacteriota bacterium]MBI3422432.1 glycosyltransferase [Acidobacteriota bacterium]